MENQNNNSTTQNTVYPPIYLQHLPNSTAVLVLGILSIVFGWCCYGSFVIGFVLSIVGLVLSRGYMNTFISNPNQYSKTSLSNMKAGKICAIIGLILSCINIIFWICLIIYVIIAKTAGNPEEILETIV